jgi:hypothetical protein
VTATIAYDKPVKNLIDKLSATGHVTHTAYKKTSVTLHHNGGRLSHEGVLSVWKTRPASAHFDVDSSGAVAQFVKVNEYAWAVGNKAGNQSSISIEMADATLAPGWSVADSTWQSAARLAGWLFFKVVGARPTKSNFFYHHHWSSTDCAGPYMEKIYDKVLTAAQSAYDSFKGSKPVTAPSTPSSPRPSAPALKAVGEVAKEVIAGVYGNQPQRTDKLRAAGYNPAAVQAEVNRILAGDPVVTKSVREIAGEVIAGKWGTGADRVSRLGAAGYNAKSVQAEVNKELGSNGPAQRKTTDQIAHEVIAGKWGNNPSRAANLRAAGYNPDIIQTAVNRLV